MLKNIRLCPTCNIEIDYGTNRREYNRQNQYNRSCKICESTGICKTCDNKVIYSSNKMKNNKEQNGKNLCEYCQQKINEIKKVELSIWRSTHIAKNNTNRWKNYDEETRIQKSKESSERWKTIWKDTTNKMHTEEFTESRKIFGEKNGMFGKSLQDVWIAKYGTEKADELINQLSKKRSINSSGDKNGMYGKPSPCSGRGISGWYKNWYFRSSIELYYMLNIIERYNMVWRSADSNDLRIHYELDNVKRTYVADFFINEKYLIECKPKHQQSFLINKIKQTAAIEFCNKKNYIYKFSSIGKFTKNEMLDMHNNKIIIIEKSKLKLLSQ